MHVNKVLPFLIIILSLVIDGCPTGYVQNSDGFCNGKYLNQLMFHLIDEFEIMSYN